MAWIRAHPYASAIAAACILAIAGTIIIVNQVRTPASIGVSAWNGNTGASTVPSAIPASSGTAPEQSAGDTENYGSQTLPYTAPSSTAPAAGTAVQSTDTDSSFDYNAFLAELSQAGAPKGSPSSASSTTAINSNAWTFIPSGLISTTSGSQASRTPTQQALYTYGNEVGSYVQGYNDTHANQVQVMEDALNDRQNTSKSQDVTAIGNDMETIGVGIADIDDAPSEALADNTAFANSYTDSGKKLIAVAQALPGRDADLVTAIETYDTAINVFISDEVALANLFKAYNVTFAPSDPGSVFTFSPSGL